MRSTGSDLHRPGLSVPVPRALSESDDAEEKSMRSNAGGLRASPPGAAPSPLPLKFMIDRRPKGVEHLDMGFPTGRACSVSSLDNRSSDLRDGRESRASAKVRSGERSDNANLVHSHVIPLLVGGTVGVRSSVIGGDTYPSSTREGGYVPL